MFKTSKASQTRAAIYEVALRLFRQKGFYDTTMRDIASEAGLSLGNAYYYFPSKEAILFDYYQAIQDEHERLVNEAVVSGKMNLRQRLQYSLTAKLEAVAADRKLLGVVFRFTGDPEHPLSVLGPATAELRRRSVSVFKTAIGDERLPKDLELLLPLSLWALHMGMLILVIYDDSKNQQRTRRLIEGAVDLTVRLLTLARLPLLKPVRTRVLAMLEEAELLGPVPA